MLFRHNDPADKPEEKKPESDNNGSVPVTPVQRDVSPAALRDLLEKNLKWSQIIYEQNRKINNKLLWSAVLSWLWFFIVVVLPTVLGFLYLPQLIRDAKTSYQSFFPAEKGASSTPQSLDELLKLLPVGDEQRAQLKAMLEHK